MPHTDAAPGALSREFITRTALTMADQVGIASVSARKLAAELDCTPMALYTYFESVADLRSAVLALAFEEVDTAPVPGERWDQTLLRTTSSIRAMYLRHAKAGLDTIDGPADHGLERHTDRIFALHEAQGIPPAMLKQIWRIIDAFLGGFIAGELSHLRGVPEPQGHTWDRTVKGAYGQHTFEQDLSIIIAGIRAVAAPDPCDWRTPD